MKFRSALLTGALAFALISIAPSAVAGALGATSVQATNLEAGKTSVTYTFTMTLATEWNRSGSLNITFPTDQGSFGGSPVAGTVECSGAGTNGTATLSVSTFPVLTVLRNNDGDNCAPTEILVVNVTGITNPTGAGASGTFGFETRNGTATDDTDPAVGGVTFTPGAPNAYGFEATTPTTVSPGASVSFNGSVKDQYGNGNASTTPKIDDGSNTFAVSMTGSSPTGNFTGSVTAPTAAGTYTYQASINNGASNFTAGIAVTVVAGAPATTSIAATSSTSVTAGTPVTFNVSLKDSNGNGNTTANPKWDDGPNTFANALTAATPAGNYTGSFTPASAGTYYINASFDGASANVTGGPIVVTVTAAPSGGGSGGSSSGSSGGSSSTTGSHGTKTGSETKSSYTNQKTHELSFTGTRGIQKIVVTLAEDGQVGFRTITSDKAATNLPTGVVGTTFWIDIAQTRGDAIDSAEITLGPFTVSKFTGELSTLKVFHDDGNGWIQVETFVEENDDGTFTVTFTARSFSPFTLAYVPVVAEETETASDTSTDTETGEESDTDTDAEGAGASQGSPGIGIVSLVALLGSALWAARRRAV